MEKYTASIIVAVSDNSTMLEYFLVHIKYFLRSNQYQTIFIIDGPVNQTVIELLEKFSVDNPSVTYKWLKQKSSYAYVNNYGRTLAKADLLIFMNTDIFITEGCLETMIASQRENHVHAVQPLLLYPQNNQVQSTGHIFGDCFNRHALKGQLAHRDIVKTSNYRQALSLALCLIPTYIFDEVQGFNEYYYNGWEGLDLTLKITQKGYKCWYEADAQAYHVEGGSRKKLQLNEDQQAAHFWSQWGSVINSDIIQLMKHQLSSIKVESPYLVYNFTTNRSWPFILSELPIEYDTMINKTEYSNENNLDFFHVLSRQALVYPGPLLFLVTSFNSLSKNFLWLQYRQKDFDMYLDLSGNLGTLKDIVCGN